MSRTADLSWSSADKATSYNVYFGTSNPPPLVGNQTQTIFDPDTMDYLTWYYWRIESVNDYGTAMGPIWSFRTESYPGKISVLKLWPILI